MPTPITAVSTSINNAASKGATDKTAPLAAGDKNIIIEDSVLFKPFTFIKYGFGTIWGIIAFTAGVWMPVPAERTTSAANKNQTLLCPLRNAAARRSVDRAMAESESMIIFFLSYRSIQTPANREITICGRKPHIVEIVSIFPDEVVSVIYQTIAYCTSEEPNREIVCAVKKRAMECFQFN